MRRAALYTAVVVGSALAGVGLGVVVSKRVARWVLGG